MKAQKWQILRNARTRDILLSLFYKKNIAKIRLPMLNASNYF